LPRLTRAPCAGTLGGVPELSRAQLAVYAAIAVVALLLGARWIRSGEPAPTESVAYGSSEEASPDTGSVEFGETGEDVVVHVAGAVREPGVYRLPEGSRVTDAIERAGGATGDADANAINLAARLADGQQIQLPDRSQAPVGVGGSQAGVGETDGPISLGSSTVEQLDSIEGIGPVTAAAILQFRDERGGVSSVDELDEISGIGPATMEALRARLQP
jgi:competence protein ComEA